MWDFKSIMEKMYFQYLYGGKIVGPWHERQCLEAVAQEWESCAGGQWWVVSALRSVGGVFPITLFCAQLCSSVWLLLLSRDAVCLGLLPSERRFIGKLCDGRSWLELLCCGSWLDGWNWTNPHHSHCVPSTSNRFSCETVCNVTICFFLDKYNPACLSVQIHPFSCVYQVIYFLQVSLVKQDLREEKKTGSHCKSQFRGKGLKGMIWGGKKLEGTRGAESGDAQGDRCWWEAAPCPPARPACALLRQQPCPPSHYLPWKEKRRMTLKPASVEWGCNPSVK